MIGCERDLGVEIGVGFETGSSWELGPQYGTVFAPAGANAYPNAVLPSGEELQKKTCLLTEVNDTWYHIHKTK